jgi:hypothetical protein
LAKGEKWLAVITATAKRPDQHEPIIRHRTRSRKAGPAADFTSAFGLQPSAFEDRMARLQLRYYSLAPRSGLFSHLCGTPSVLGILKGWRGSCKIMNTIHSRARWPGCVLSLLCLLVLVPVLLSGCKSPITNTNTITIGNIGTNAVAGMSTNSPSAFSTDMLNSVSSLVNDIAGLITDVKSIKESQAQHASEDSTIEITEVIIIVVSAGGILIYVRKTRLALLEEMEANAVPAQKIEDAIRKMEALFADNRKAVDDFDKLLSKKMEDAETFKVSLNALSQEIEKLKRSKENMDLDEVSNALSGQLETIKSEVKPYPEAAEALAKAEESHKLFLERIERLKALKAARTGGITIKKTQ